MEPKISVLFIDDETNNLLSFKATFRRDFNLFLAESAKQAREILAENPIDIIISDQRMPYETGVEFFETIINEYPNAIRILLTGFTDIQAVIDAINKAKVYHYLTKPWDQVQLKQIIYNAYEVYRLRIENKMLTNQLQLANQQLEFLLRQKLLS